jgi:hypothetical protein
MDALQAGDPHAADSQGDWPERWVAREGDCSVVPVERRWVFRAEVDQGDYQAELVE